MKRYYAALLFAGIASLSACGGGTGSVNPPAVGGGGIQSTPPPQSSVGANTIGIALPDGAIGTMTNGQFGKIGGYTQSVYSQVLAFAPGTTITLKNLSSTTPHTLNVLGTNGFPVESGALYGGGRRQSSDDGLSKRFDRPGRHDQRDTLHAGHLLHRLRIPLQQRKQHARRAAGERERDARPPSTRSLRAAAAAGAWDCTVADARFLQSERDNAPGGDYCARSCGSKPRDLSASSIKRDMLLRLFRCAESR